jgi:(S)-mandelate dehydrogenase
MGKISDADTIEELRAQARKRIPRAVFDFIDGGSDAEVTLSRNRRDLAEMSFLPRQPRDVSQRDLSTKIFGVRSGLPLVIAPTGLAALGWPQADIALARAARSFNIPFTISTASSVRLETIAAAAEGARLWFQVYIYRDRDLVASLVERSRAAGVEALVVTVDTPVLGWRRRDHANRFTVPLKATPALALDLVRRAGWSLQIARHGVPRMQNFVDAGQGGDIVSLSKLMANNMDASVTWNDIRWLRDRWPGKLIVKGVLSPADAIEALEAGVDGVQVSNHGGRQLDGAISAISALPAVAAAVAGRAEVLVDSGFRHGSDIAKAVAMGASAVAVGRATLFGVSAGGDAGAHRALEILQTEYDRCLALLGCRSTAELDASRVTPGFSVRQQPPGAPMASAT